MSSAAVLCNEAGAGAGQADGGNKSVTQPGGWDAGLTNNPCAESGMEEFNALFTDPAGQRQQICLALQKLVARVAKRITFPSKQRREELTGDVYLDCVARIARCDATRHNAYRWFALVARRRFWMRIRRDRYRKMWSINDVDTDTAELRPLHHATLHSAPPLPPLTSGKVRDRLAEYLDELLHRAIKAHHHATGESAQMTRGMVLAVQQVRRRVVGTYQAMREGDLAYTARRRVETEDRDS